MPQSWVGGSTANLLGVGSDSVSTAWPVGTASGDFALLLVSWYENSSSGQPVPLTGFTSCGHVFLLGTGDQESWFDLWYRQLNGTEAGNVTVGRVGDVAWFGTIVLGVLRGNGALTFASATPGTASLTPATAPDVAGVSGQILLSPFGLASQGTASTPTGMTLGQAGLQNTATGYIFYQFLAADPGAKSSTIGNAFPAAGISVLLNDAGAAPGGGGGIADVRGGQPYNYSLPITKSDAANFPLCDAIYVGGAGVVVAVLESGATVAFTATAGQTLPIQAKRVNSTSTTATLMVALYQV
jgi:hypothetical protein